MTRSTHQNLISILALAALVTPALLGCSGCVGRYYAGNNTTSFGSNTTLSSSSNGSSNTVIKTDDPEQVASADGQQSAFPDEPLKEDPHDWSFWRGPEYNGVSRETGLIDDFDIRGGKGSNVKWKKEDLGGRSTPITLLGKLYIIVRDKPGTEEEGEKVVCLDLESGKVVWENKFNVWLSDVPKERTGWSSVVGDPTTGNVYALGVCGYFQCINGKTGETIWSNAMHENFGLLSTYGGRTNFPVICDDLVIISAIVIGWGDMAKPAHRFIAFDKKTGTVVWYNGTRLLPYDTTYSSPTLTVLGGQKALVFGSGDGAVWALQPRTGKPIWNYGFSRRGLNVSPLVVGDKVFTGHAEENVVGTSMGAIAGINALADSGDITKKGELWCVQGMKVGKSSPIYVDGRLYYCADGAKLHIIDPKTGEELFRSHSLGGTMMRASPLYADGKIYAFSTSAWQIFQPDERRGVKVISKGRLPSSEEVYASPICSHGKVIIQTTAGLYCLEDKDQKHGITDRPEPPQEAPIEEDEKPAFVQVVPAEVLMKPGRIKAFTARVYNSRGQLLDKAPEATFEIEGPGDIAPDNGAFLAPSETHVATIVTAKVGDLEGRARVRIVGSLPWKFDFEELDEPPVTWVGARYRHAIREKDGSKVMVKVTTIPKGTRSRCWFGPSDLHDYTMQADVMGAITDNKMPDIGLMAQGYTLKMQGAHQKLEIRTWDPHEFRTHKRVDFKWSANTWYTMKFRVANEDGKAVLRGKVWPREDMEPADWNIEVSDSAPNTSGSPGLFGNAREAELYLDNITIVENDSDNEQESTE